MKTFCIYKHTSPNNKCYIGITSSNPLYRWRNGNGYSGQPKFYKAILKYGWDNFKHEILYTDLTKKEAEIKEIELIDYYNSIDNGYNVSTGGEYTHSGACKYKGLIVNDCEVLELSNENKLILKCLDCGNVFERTHTSIKKNCVKCKCKVKKHRNPNPTPKNYCIITHNGKTQSVQEWSKELGIPVGTIRSRYKKGQDITIALKQPKQTCNCEICNNPFIRNYKSQKYCSKECQWNSMKKKRETRFCNYCGKEFELKRVISKDYKGLFCSHKCQINSMKIEN